MPQAALELCYEVGVRWDAETGSHVAYAPVFRLHAQGKTDTEALEKMNRGVDLYFRTLAKTGEVFATLRRLEVPVYGANDQVPESRRNYARELKEQGYERVTESRLVLHAA